MSKTRIFVSSTCYDLAAIRESLRDYISELGHETLLSEYPSFPVDPSETAIANCKQNVRKNTDVLVLIIGGRRGSLDPESGKSITNLEYEEAQQQGIPCFVFINRSVDNLLHVWKKNPNADFAPTVDCPDVFKFIEQIRSKNRWAFTFDKSVEIKEYLGIQLSTMLRSLLERKKVNTLDPTAGFANESEEAKRLAQEKPDYWEFLLTAELLKTKLMGVRKRFNRQKAGLSHVPSKAIDGLQFIRWIEAKINDLVCLVRAIEYQLPVIQASWGPPGKPGDAHQIQQSVDELIVLCNQLLDWEDELRSMRPPEQLRPLRETMKGWTEGILDKMEMYPAEILRPFKDAARPTSVTVCLSLDAPPMDNFQIELEKAKKLNPLDYIF